MKNIAISFFGLISSIVVIAITILLERSLDLAFYSAMHLFLIPTGAIITGFGAASGYYLGSILLNARPTLLILLYMVLVSVATYFAINYANYLLLEVEGVKASALVSFSRYMDLVLTKTSMTVVRTNVKTGELGTFGYIVAVLQILGFAIGGFFSYYALSQKPLCHWCDRYYKRIWQDTRYSGANNSEQMLEGIKIIAEAFDDENKIDFIREQHTKIGNPKESNETHLRTQLSLHQCLACNRKIIAIETSRFEGNDWKPIKDLSFGNLFLGTNSV